MMRKLFVVGIVSLVLVASGQPKRPWLGMGLVLRTEAQGRAFLYVAHAPEDAPAYRAGLRTADLITAIDGKKISFRDDLDLIEYTSALVAGKVLRLSIVRAGKEQEIRLRVGTLPPNTRNVSRRACGAPARREPSAGIEAASHPPPLSLSRVYARDKLLAGWLAPQ